MERTRVSKVAINATHLVSGVATRAGFVAEGIERWKLRYGDTRYDVELHARLADDPTPAILPPPMITTSTSAGA